MKLFKNTFGVGVFFCLSLIKTDGGCLAENKTYVINVKAHVESQIQEAIVSVASKLGKGKNLANEYVSINGETATVAATRAYLGTVFEDLNNDLMQYKVQVNLVLDPQEIDQFDNMGKVDPSCELGDALKSRVQTMFDFLTDKYSKSVGNHLYIVGCPISQDSFSQVEVIEKSTCGRVFGVMWNGSTNTKALIKSAIMQSLTGTPNTYASGSFNLSDKNNLCRYCENCISSAESFLGVLLDDLTKVTFTNEQ